MLIVDEVHAIGSENMQNAIIEKYDFRLGLSATPIRHFDDEGSRIIQNYFSGVVYELGIEKAIDKGFLVPYEYLPFYAELNDTEMTEYRELTKRIALKYGKHGNEREREQVFANFAENERASLVANAEGKYDILEEILESKKNKLQDSLIYCHDRQLSQVTHILTSRNIVSDSVTWKDPTADRLKIINNLANHHFDCITAIRCLDEGVDIPSATIAIIMASTGNPRQYIQRRGRVLRRNEITNKQKAIIYDILVKPPLSPDQTISKMERKLVARELLRHKEFALIAQNRVEAIERIRVVAQTYNINLDALSSEYINNL